MWKYHETSNVVNTTMRKISKILKNRRLIIEYGSIITSEMMSFDVMALNLCYKCKGHMM